MAVAARAALFAGRLALLRGDVDATTRCAVEARPSADAGGTRAPPPGRRPARRRGAGGCCGEVAGIKLAIAAVARAESLGDAWLATTTRGVLDRVTVAP